jgi:hypothetical protein
MRRKTTQPTRLQLETLESRDLLTADPFATPIPMTNPNGDSVLPGYGFPGQYSTLVAAATIGYPTPSVGFVSVPGSNVVLTGTDLSGSPSSSFTAPAATTATGQMTITTGANTPGIGSFATSTLGYGSENGGRSGG